MTEARLTAETRHEPRATSRQEGRLDLALARVDGLTRAVRCLAQPPVQVSRARYDHAAAPDEVTLTLVHLGGILAGDRYHLDVRLEAGARATVTTAAATQVLSMAHGNAAQDTRLTLAAGSRLRWLPEPLILFAAARFSQRTTVTLGEGASLALLDVLCPGRLARGEAFAFDRYEARLEVVSCAGRCLVAERAVVEPSRHDPRLTGVLGATPVVGSLYLLGDEYASLAAEDLAAGEDPRMGVTTLPHAAGLLVRAVGDAPSEVRQRLLAALERLAR